MIQEVWFTSCTLSGSREMYDWSGRDVCYSSVRESHTEREVGVFRELSPQTEAAFKKQFKSGLNSIWLSAVPVNLQVTCEFTRSTRPFDALMIRVHCNLKKLTQYNNCSINQRC